MTSLTSPDTLLAAVVFVVSLMGVAFFPELRKKKWFSFVLGVAALLVACAYISTSWIMKVPLQTEATLIWIAAALANFAKATWPGRTK